MQAEVALSLQSGKSASRVRSFKGPSSVDSIHTFSRQQHILLMEEGRDLVLAGAGGELCSAIPSLCQGLGFFSVFLSLCPQPSALLPLSMRMAPFGTVFCKQEQSPRPCVALGTGVAHPCVSRSPQLVLLSLH